MRRARAAGTETDFFPWRSWLETLAYLYVPLDEISRRPDDRRQRRRFPVGLELNYKTTGGSGERLVLGAGRTIDISSHGVRFQADRALPIGTSVKLSIQWPLLLEGSCGLRLVILGRVVRTGDTETAVRIQRHEFRTCPVQQSEHPQRKAMTFVA